MIPPWSRAVCDRLESAGVRYVATGGTAVVLHGFVRPIADLDIVISSAPDEVSAAMNVLRQAGFAPSLPLPMSLLTVMRMFDGSGQEVDVFVRYAIPFEELWASSQPVRVEGSVIRILSLDQLLRVKRIQARPHDLSDVEGLLGLRQS